MDWLTNGISQEVIINSMIVPLNVSLTLVYFLFYSLFLILFLLVYFSFYSENITVEFCN